VCVCVCVCARACVRVCICECVRACVYVGRAPGREMCIPDLKMRVPLAEACTPAELSLLGTHPLDPSTSVRADAAGCALDQCAFVPCCAPSVLPADHFQAQPRPPRMRTYLQDLRLGVCLGMEVEAGVALQTQGRAIPGMRCVHCVHEVAHDLRRHACVRAYGAHACVCTCTCTCGVHGVHEAACDQPARARAREGRA